MQVGNVQTPPGTRILEQPVANQNKVAGDNEAVGSAPDGDTDRDDAVQSIPSSGSGSSNTTSSLGNNVNVKV